LTTRFIALNQHISLPWSQFPKKFTNLCSIAPIAEIRYDDILALDLSDAISGRFGDRPVQLNYLGLSEQVLVLIYQYAKIRGIDLCERLTNKLSEINFKDLEGRLSPINLANCPRVLKVGCSELSHLCYQSRGIGLVRNIIY